MVDSLRAGVNGFENNHAQDLLIGLFFFCYRCFGGNKPGEIINPERTCLEILYQASNPNTNRAQEESFLNQPTIAVSCLFTSQEVKEMLDAY